MEQKVEEKVEYGQVKVSERPQPSEAAAQMIMDHNGPKLCS